MKFQQQNMQSRRGNLFQTLDLSREGARFHVVGVEEGYALKAWIYESDTTQTYR